MHNPELARRLQAGHGLMLKDGDPAFTFVDIARLVDAVALGTTVNAEALYEDLNLLAGRVATARHQGQHPDAGRQTARGLISQIETIYRGHFHLEPDEQAVAGAKRATKPFARFARFILDKLGVEPNAGIIAS